MSDLVITDGTSRAVITITGAGLREFTVDGAPYVETFAEGEHPPLGAGCVLVPWPNRTEGARWHLNGDLQELEVTEPDRGNAIHGLVRRAQWTVSDVSTSAVSLEYVIEPQAGWPVRLLTTITYALNHDGLTVTHGVRNDGGRAIPFGVGVHPYPRAGGAATDDCELRLSASTVLPLDPARMVPTGPATPVTGTEYDFHMPRPIRGLALDTPFGGCTPGPDGLVRHSVIAPGGGRVDIWADPDFRWVQVFTPDQFPGRGRAIAIEPMTCPPDALNSGTDLITLDPGESWSGRWGLQPVH